MGNRRAKMILVVAAVTIVGLAVPLTAWLTSGGGSKPSTHASYAQLFQSAIVGTTRISSVLDQWPKPYQDYHDGLRNRCLEWLDEPKLLLDLCFDKNGVLFRKLTP